MAKGVAPGIQKKLGGVNYGSGKSALKQGINRPGGAVVKGKK